MGSISQFLAEGGVVAWLLVFTGVAGIIFAVDRIQYLFLANKLRSDESLAQVFGLIAEREYLKVIQICNREQDSPELSVIKAGLLAIDDGREAMRSSLGAVAVTIARNCERRISALSLIANVATLFGLLGTIVGLITTFSGLGVEDALTKAQLLSHGISQAMSTTAGGLVIGIFAMVSHTVCSSRADEIIEMSHKVGYDLIAVVEKSERA